MTGLIKIRVFVPMNTKDVLIRDIDASFIGTPEFSEKTYDKDSKFREPIITFINDAIGTDGWCIRFTQFDETETWYDADIYCNTKQDAQKIASIIKDKLIDIRFNWFYKGTISTYS